MICRLASRGAATQLNMLERFKYPPDIRRAPFELRKISSVVQLNRLKFPQQLSQQLRWSIRRKVGSEEIEEARFSAGRTLSASLFMI